MTDQRFLIDYAFKSGIGSYIPPNDTRVNRLEPNRIGLDIFNVKDFGATGDGIHDDGPAILATLAFAYANANFTIGGTVFFPAGTYFISTGNFPIMLNNSVGGAALRIIGAGRDATIITGTYSTGQSTALGPNPSSMFIKGFQAGFQWMSDLTIWNQSTNFTAACYLGNGNDGMEFNNVHFIGPRGAIAEDECYTMEFVNCRFTCGNPLLIGRADSALPGPLAGTFGVTYGQGIVRNCIFEGFDIGIGLALSASGSGGVQSAFVGGMVTCNYIYRCNYGIQDKGSAAIQTASGVMLRGNQFDRCNWGIYFNGLSRSSVIANRVGGISNLGGPCDPAPINGMTLSGGQVSVTTSAVHNLSTGAKIQLVNIVSSSGSFIPPGNTTGIVTVTVDNSTTFHYANAGSASGFTSGSWNYPMTYGIAIRGSQHVIYAANMLDAPVSLFSFDASGITPAIGISLSTQFLNSVYSMQLPFGFNQPGFATGGEGFGIPRMGWDFVGWETTGINNPNVFMNFNDLQPQFEGQEKAIVNASTVGFGAAVSGGGSNHYKIRYNNTLSWIRVG